MKGAKSESSESSAPPILVGPGTSTPGASPKTVDFSRRAGDLAAMLDSAPGAESGGEFRHTQKSQALDRQST